MRLLIKLYLWVSSKSSSGFVFKGDLTSGSLGFAIPIYILMIAVAHPIEKIFRIDIFRRRIIEYILEFSSIKDYTLQILFDKRSYNRIIKNLEGFFKNDYITEKDYRWIIDEIECRMNKIESNQNKMSQLFRHIFCKQYI